MPHAKDRTQAAFRNMHVRFIDCLVCHAAGSRGSWIAERPAPKPATGDTGLRRNRWRISTSTPPVERARMHTVLGTALSCRACHSPDGSREIAGDGGGLPAGFVDPVPLRMIEEGAKQWMPDTMR